MRLRSWSTVSCDSEVLSHARRKKVPSIAFPLSKRIYGIFTFVSMPPAYSQLSLSKTLLKVEFEGRLRLKLFRCNSASLISVDAITCSGCARRVPLPSAKS